MEKSRYEHLCLEAEAGRDAFVAHPGTHEEGIVKSCIMPSDHLVVETTESHKRCWDFHECEDLERPKIGPMVF